MCEGSACARSDPAALSVSDWCHSEVTTTSQSKFLAWCMH